MMHMLETTKSTSRERLEYLKTTPPLVSYNALKELKAFTALNLKYKSTLNLKNKAILILAY